MGEFNNYSGMIALIIFLILFVLFVKYEAKHMDEDDEDEKEVVLPQLKEQVIHPLDLTDEDATVACLIAAIEHRKQTHKNVQIISVREVK